MYHGSTVMFPIEHNSQFLREGSYVTPYIWAARLFAVRWDKDEVLDIDPNKPEEILRFRRKAPTNMGKDWPYVYTTKVRLHAQVVEEYHDWREFLPFTEDEDNWLR